MDANLTDSLVIEETALIKTELAADADRPESFRGSASDNQVAPELPGAVERLRALAPSPLLSRNPMLYQIMKNNTRADIGPLVHAMFSLRSENEALNSELVIHPDGRGCEDEGSLVRAAIPIRLLAPVLPADGWHATIPPVIQTFPHLTSVPEWADAINGEITDQTMDDIEFGRFIHAGRLSLKFGGWTELYHSRSLPFSKSTGEKWSLIGDVCGPFAQDPEHLGKWPCLFEALHQISRLGPELVLQLLRSGVIHSGLKESQARDLVRKYRPELECEPRASTVKSIIAKIRRLVLAVKGTPEELEYAWLEMQDMADEMAAKAGFAIESSSRKSETEAQELENENRIPLHSHAARNGNSELN
jgi:hypothetical protein